MEHGDVDRALAEARQAIDDVSLAPGDAIASAWHSTEWVTPVLHLGASSSQLFPPPPLKDFGVVAESARDLQVVEPGKAVPLLSVGHMEQLSQMHWRLVYETELGLDPTLDRVENGIQITAEVRQIRRFEHGLEAKLNGVFPWAWAATEQLTVMVETTPTGSRAVIECHPKQRQLRDEGRSKIAIERIAGFLKIPTGP